MWELIFDILNVILVACMVIGFISVGAMAVDEIQQAVHNKKKKDENDAD